MDEPAARGKATLDRDSWIQAAVGILAEEGIDGVRIEVLAKRCKVTKGSFYWHFRDRQDLLSAVLADWREGRIRDITKQTAAARGQELDQIHHVIDVYSANRNRRGILIELAVRDWARRDAEAAAVVEEVDRVRLELGQRLFLQRGVPDREAAARSLLLYAYVFGQSLMNYDHFATDIPALKNWIAGHIAGDEA